MAEGTQNRRYPQNLQGVLRLAVEAGSATDGPAPINPMSEEVGLRAELPDPCLRALLCLYQNASRCTRSWLQNIEISTRFDSGLSSGLVLKMCVSYLLSQCPQCMYSLRHVSLSTAFPKNKIRKYLTHDETSGGENKTHPQETSSKTFSRSVVVFRGKCG